MPATPAAATVQSASPEFLEVRARGRACASNGLREATACCLLEAAAGELGREVVRILQRGRLRLSRLCFTTRAVPPECQRGGLALHGP